MKPCQAPGCTSTRHSPAAAYCQPHEDLAVARICRAKVNFSVGEAADIAAAAYAEVTGLSLEHPKVQAKRRQILLELAPPAAEAPKP